MNNFWLVLPIIIPLGTAFVLPVVRRVSHSIRALVCIGAMTATLFILLRLAGPILNGEILVYWMGGWEAREELAVGISLSVDAWGWLTALVVALVGLMALIYSAVYMRDQAGKGPYYVLVMLLIAGLIGFALSGDLFNQFVWLEVLSVAAFALTGFHIHDHTAVEAAFKYLLTNTVASFFVVLGLILLYMQTGALNLAQVAQAFEPTAAGLVAIGLLVGGYATKAALVPWHFWLPDAHAVAPSPISALFSGALIKIGIYAIGRAIFTLAPIPAGSPAQLVLLFIAALTMLLGGVQMVQQQSIKRLLAFSSVSQMGYIALGLALGTPLGVAAATLHIISHALLKSTLFLGAGTVTWRAGIHNLAEGGGLARRMPITCATMCLAGLGLSGVPLFSSYVSKTMLEEAAFAAGLDPLAWVAIAASVLTFVGMARLVWGVFGPRQHAPSRFVREAPPVALLPGVVLLAGALLVGLLPNQTAANIAWATAETLTDRDRYIAAVLEPESTLHSSLFTLHSPLPEPLDWHHWAIPAAVVAVGSLLAYLSFRPEWWAARRWMRPVRLAGSLTRRWHSGLVMDYVLWNALATAVSAFVALLTTWFSF